jgi:hypothetical protein
MQDMQVRLDKLRVQIAECELIWDLETDSQKRELFVSLAKHFEVFLAEVEKMIGQLSIRDTSGRRTDTFLGRKTYEPFPKRGEE